MIGRKIIKFNSIESTNVFIRNNINKLNHGDLVTAKSQSKGKGRHGNTWLSKEGNLYFSFLLKEDLKRSEIFNVIIKCSISIVRLLKLYDIEAMIKYPNDIVVKNHKISGILIESVGYNDINNLIVGIGLNVNQESFDELDILATSIINETKEKYDLVKVLDNFINIYNSIKDFENLYKEYIDKSVIIGTKVNYNNTEYIIKNIQKNGSITLENDEYIERIVDYGSISLSNLYTKKK